jgi:hypothetical protein
LIFFFLSTAEVEAQEQTDKTIAVPITPVLSKENATTAIKQ